VVLEDVAYFSLQNPACLWRYRSPVVRIIWCRRNSRRVVEQRLARFDAIGPARPRLAGSSTNSLAAESISRYCPRPHTKCAITSRIYTRAGGPNRVPPDDFRTDGMSRTRPFECSRDAIRDCGTGIRMWTNSARSGVLGRTCLRDDGDWSTPRIVLNNRPHAVSTTLPNLRLST